MKFTLISKFTLILYLVLQSFALYAQLPSGLKKYFACQIQDKSTKDSLVFISECDQYYSFIGENFRYGRVIIDDDENYMFTTELYIDKEMLNGYIVMYEIYQSSAKKVKTIWSRGDVKEGKLNGMVELFNFGKLSAKVEYQNDLKNGKQIIYRPSGADSVHFFDEYKRGLLNGQSIRINSNNDTVYHRMYKNGYYKYSYFEKSPNEYPPKVMIKYKKNKK